jgi:uncharacterized protein YdeI (YjbR/CyaY-like superfamily)
LRFRAPKEWRRWLETNHATEREAQLVIAKKATAGGAHYLEALEEALCFGWIDGRIHAHDAGSFLLRFSPRRADSFWSEANRDRVRRLIRDGKMTPAGLSKVDEAKRNGAWALAMRARGKPRMPADLGAALQGVPEAWSHFRTWGNSFQANYIHWVLDAKRPETRKRRIQRVVERARQNKRPGIEGP